jgi:hypothetical protein
MIPTATRLDRFPFPFRDDAYRYSTNVEPALGVQETAAGRWGDRILDIDERYDAELAERAEILRRDPSRSASAPHMRAAEWDALAYGLAQLAASYPAHMQFVREGARWHWTNALQGLELDVTFGDDASLPGGPLAFLATQIQEDIALLDQREDALWLDAGVVTFDTGMRFLEIHGPVPRVHEERIITRAQQFMMRMQPNEAYRRTNWTMSVDGRLDTSTETYPEWGPDRVDVTDDAALPDRLHLRVEVQHLIRLPHSGAILFLIRSYLEPLSALAEVPGWAERIGGVLRELPDDMADYKGIARYRHRAADWLLSPAAQSRR